MTTGLNLLEDIYQQLHHAGLIGSKAEFSERFLGKSRSYLTSMRARNRQISNDTVMRLDAALRAEIRARDKDRDVADRIVMRRALADINVFLGTSWLLDMQTRHPNISAPSTHGNAYF